MKCADCSNWITSRKTVYGNGADIVTYTSPDGSGDCSVLKMQTVADFGCIKFAAGSNHAQVARKTGTPWQNWVMIPCPDCHGKGDGGRGHRCAGTGMVRLYDDGYVGDEQTRMHPRDKEIVVPPKCQQCGENVNLNWVACPACGTRLKIPLAETEVVSDELSIGLPFA